MFLIDFDPSRDAVYFTICNLRLSNSGFLLESELFCALLMHSKKLDT